MKKENRPSKSKTPLGQRRELTEAQLATVNGGARAEIIEIGAQETPPAP